MRKFASVLLILVVSTLFFTACEKEKEKSTPPELPPAESMQIDFSIKDDSKAAVESLNTESSVEGTQVNFTAAATNIAIMNTLLGSALVVPVAAFAHSFAEEPVFLGDAKWQWQYTVDGWFGKHTARLTGEIRNNDVKWEMYITRTGIEPYDEFLWFEGTSALDGNSGDWLLYHSAAFQEPMLTIDWERTGEEIGDIKYTYVRELVNERSEDPAYGSYVQAGRLDAELDAYYTIYLAESDRTVNIEWNLTNYNGRIKYSKPLWPFSDTNWNCWDEQGFDMVCE